MRYAPSCALGPQCGLRWPYNQLGPCPGLIGDIHDPRWHLHSPVAAESCEQLLLLETSRGIELRGLA